MRTPTLAELGKKPVFSHLKNEGDRELARQAYLALQKFLNQGDSTDYDALLKDKGREERLTETRHDLQPMGITILAALRTLIERERNEVTVVTTSSAPPIQRQREQKAKQKTTRFYAKAGTIADTPQRKERVIADFSRHVIVRQHDQIYEAGRLTTSIEIRVASALEDAVRESMLTNAPKINKVQVARKLEKRISPAYRQRLLQLNIELELVS
jgi:hypothetical protein